MSRRLPVAAAVAATFALAACGGTGDDATRAGTPAPGTGTSAGLSGELTVFAAASLSTVFEEIAGIFTEQHPGSDVAFSFAGSSDLVAQLGAGAPADVLATADESTMADAVDGGTVIGEPGLFAGNVLTLVAPAGNPAGVTGLDGSLDGADVVVCAPQVPCGAATAELADLLGVTLSPVSEEGSVTDVLGKVTSGQADAGLVYSTDAASAGDAVEAIPVDRADEVVNRYAIAVAVGTDEPDLAAAWVQFVLGQEAAEVLTDAGFTAP